MKRDCEANSSYAVLAIGTSRFMQCRLGRGGHRTAGKTVRTHSKASFQRESLISLRSCLRISHFLLSDDPYTPPAKPATLAASKADP